MRKITTLFAGFVLGVSLLTSVPAYASPSIIEVKVQGMVCDFCARAIEKTIEKQDEVASLEVDLTTKLLTIKLKPGKDLDDETITKLVTNAGYAVKEIIR